MHSFGGSNQRNKHSPADIEHAPIGDRIRGRLLATEPRPDDARKLVFALVLVLTVSAGAALLGLALLDNMLPPLFEAPPLLTLRRRGGRGHGGGLRSRQRRTAAALLRLARGLLRS